MDKLRVRFRLRQLLSAYERGIVTVNAVTDKIVDELAIFPAFYELLDEFPEECLSRIKAMAGRDISHPEDTVNLASYCGPARSDEEWEEIRQRESHGWYWSHRRLREHFLPGESVEPRFEPIRLLGTVEETFEANGVIVVLGDFWSHTKRHPFLIVTPDGRRIETRWVDSVVVHRDRERESDDVIWRKCGRKGWVFGPEVQSTADVPSGSEVYVDRSAVPPLPNEPPLELFERG